MIKVGAGMVATGLTNRFTQLLGKTFEKNENGVYASAVERERDFWLLGAERFSRYLMRDKRGDLTKSIGLAGNTETGESYILWRIKENGQNVGLYDLVYNGGSVAYGFVGDIGGEIVNLSYTKDKVRRVARRNDEFLDIPFP